MRPAYQVWYAFEPWNTTKKVDEMLALLILTTFEENPSGARAWKGHDWNMLNRLHIKGHISDPISKAKSVVVPEEA